MDIWITVSVNYNLLRTKLGVLARTNWIIYMNLPHL